MSSITHFFGRIFEPIFHAIAWMLAFLYGIVPNYAGSIALLTLIIMGVLTPLTVKSTRSMMAMQKVQPEIKKLQQKYKGPENRQLLNEELMRLYREEGINPLGGCLPMLLQTPFLIVLYNVIKGLSYTVTTKAGKVIAEPRYIPHTSKMYANLVSSGGHINSFGMDLSLRPFPISLHGSWAASLPFFAFVAAAVVLQYFQMAQINKRALATGQKMPSQQQTMQRVLPIVFAYIYLIVPAAVVLYMIVSTVIRIITQDIMFRTGVSDPRRHGIAAAKGSVEIPGTAEEKPAEAPAPRSNPRPAPKSTAAGRAAARNSPKANPRPQSHPRARDKRKRKAR